MELKQIATGINNFYKKHPVLSNILLIIVTGLVIAWGSFIFLSIWTDHGSKITVPDVKNMSYEIAYDTLRAAGFGVEIGDSVYDSGHKPGTVIETWPRSGATVKPGREVYLTLSSFQPRTVSVDMPLTNMDSRQALSYLEETLGITHVRIVSVPSAYPDLVISAKHDGQEILPGTKLQVNSLVTLEVGTVPTVTEVDDDYDEPVQADDVYDASETEQ